MLCMFGALFCQRQEAESVWYFLWAVLPWSGVCWHGKAGSTLRSSQAVPHPSTNRALCRLTSEVRRDPVHSTWYGRQQILWNKPTCHQQFANSNGHWTMKNQTSGGNNEEGTWTSQVQVGLWWQHHHPTTRPAGTSPPLCLPCPCLPTCHQP